MSVNKLHADIYRPDQVHPIHREVRRALLVGPMLVLDNHEAGGQKGLIVEHD